MKRVRLKKHESHKPSGRATHFSREETVYSLIWHLIDMRCIIQRVKSASVSVGDDLISSIGRGICVLVGIHKDDKEEDAVWM